MNPCCLTYLDRAEAAEAEVARLREYIAEADRRVGEQFMAAETSKAHCIRTQLARLFDTKRADEAEAERDALRAALESIAAETSATNATEAADRFQRIARAALTPTQEPQA